MVRGAVVRSGLIVVGLGVTAFVGRAALRRQAAVARRRIGKPLGEEAVDADRVWRRRQEGVPIELLLLGDSLAAGLGAERRKDTLGARLSKGLAQRTGRPVRLKTAAVVGSESSALAHQLDALPPDYRADVVVIVVGGNDVTHMIPPSTSTAHLETAIRRVRAEGATVVVGTCPDLGTLRPVPQPLRALMARMSRHLAAAQTRTAERAGAVPVDLRRAVGHHFHAEPDDMFSLDRFHPSAAGYRRTAEALLPAVVAALGRRVDPAPADDSVSDWRVAGGSRG